MTTLAVPVSEQEFVPDTEPLATWWRQLTPGTFYWRCLLAARHLPGRVNALRATDFVVGEDDEPRLLRQHGASIWQFSGNATRALIMAQTQAHGIKVLMEVDDNYLVPPPHIPNTRSSWTTTLDRTELDHYSHQAHRRIVQWVDGVIVSTPYLADVYTKATSVPVFVCPNSVDPDDWPEIEPRERTVTVGYAGSASHQYDLHLVERALDSAHRSGARLVKLGAGTAGWRWPHKQVPWTDDLAAYRRSLQNIDIGLCPVRRGPWQDGKSDIKAMEYVMAGAIPIVQRDSPCYQDWASRTLSANSKTDWDKAVREALSLTPDERHSLWAGLHDWVMAEKTIGSHIHKWREAVQ